MTLLLLLFICRCSCCCCLFDVVVVVYLTLLMLLTLLLLRSEEHTSELQSRVDISYAVFCLKKNFFNDTATTEIYTLSLHDALPIFDVDVVVVYLTLMLLLFI